LPARLEDKGLLSGMDDQRGPQSSQSDLLRVKKAEDSNLDILGRNGTGEQQANDQEQRCSANRNVIPPDAATCGLP